MSLEELNKLFDSYGIELDEKYRKMVKINYIYRIKHSECKGENPCIYCPISRRNNNSKTVCPYNNETKLAFLKIYINRLNKKKEKEMENKIVQVIYANDCQQAEILNEMLAEGGFKWRNGSKIVSCRNENYPVKFIFGNKKVEGKLPSEAISVLSKLKYNVQIDNFNDIIHPIDDIRGWTKQPVIEITIKVDGLNVMPSLFSKEAWEKIREGE